MSELERCIREGKLVRIRIEPDIVEKELKEARADLESSRASEADGNAKWAIVQAYYSMFHTAKALALHRGYREKSHLCLSIALRGLFTGLDPRHARNFRDCMALREDADYGLTYSDDSAKEAIRWAGEFLEDASILIKP